MANTRGIEQTRTDVSVLFSEPKIPQLTQQQYGAARRYVSVLFSEPKIPQCRSPPAPLFQRDRFSALQRAENSSMRHPQRQTQRGAGVSVLFSEPKIPQS